MPPAKAKVGAAVKKPKTAKGYKLAERFPNGEQLKSFCKKEWSLGEVIGQGGFGMIYVANQSGSSISGPQKEYVLKIEPIANGPLFCEVHFYQRVAKPELISEWIKEKKLRYLGVPAYISSGSHTYNGVKYRFLVMDKFGTDLQKLFDNAGKRFPRETVFALALRLIDALEYIHQQNYIHGDVKASNCLLGFKNGKPDPDSVYLVDFGLAMKYTMDDHHKEYKADPKRAHDGTIEFTSIDAHNGVETARRSDMEILGYCLLQWLCGLLPWEDKLENKESVRAAKIKYMADLSALMKKCFPKGDGPAEIQQYFALVKGMQYEDKPAYNKMREIFKNGLVKLAIKDYWKLHLPMDVGKPSTAPKKGVKRSASPHIDSPKKSKMAAKPKGIVGTPKASPRNGATPKSKAGTSKVKTVTPKVRAKTATPKSKAVTPKSKTVTPKTKKVTPKTKKVTPKTKKVTPKTKTVTPKTKKVTPKTKTVTPKTKTVTPKTKTVTPKKKTRTVSPRGKAGTPKAKTKVAAIKSKATTSQAQAAAISDSTSDTLKQKPKVSSSTLLTSPVHYLQSNKGVASSETALMKRSSSPDTNGPVQQKHKANRRVFSETDIGRKRQDFCCNAERLSNVMVLLAYLFVLLKFYIMVALHCKAMLLYFLCDVFFVQYYVTKYMYLPKRFRLLHIVRILSAFCQYISCVCTSGIHDVLVMY